MTAHTPASLSTSPLLRIPQEVLVRISTFLYTDQLGALRRTCKEIEARLFSDFALTFFTKRQFMIEHVSLAALVGIANHPALAPYVVDVIIGTHILSTDRSSTAEKNYMENDFVDRQTLIHTGMARDMLTEAFSKLPNIRSIGIRDYSAAGRVRDGPMASWRSWGWTYSNETPCTAMSDPTPMLPLVLSSLSTAKARPSRLEVFLHKHGKLSPAAFMIHNPSGTNNIFSLLGNLKVVMLELTFDSNFVTRERYDAEDHLKEFPLKKFIQHISNVETLRLNFRPDELRAARFLQWFGSGVDGTMNPGPANNLNFFPSVALPALTTLELGRATVKISTLLPVLTKFDLTSISLWEMTLKPEQSDDQDEDLWESALETLSTQLSSSSRIHSILIGRARQAYRRARRAVQVAFVPEGTTDQDKGKVFHSDQISFKAKFTSIPVHQWLAEKAKCTFVPGIHSESAMGAFVQQDFGQVFHNGLVSSDIDGDEEDESDDE